MNLLSHHKSFELMMDAVYKKNKKISRHCHTLSANYYIAYYSEPQRAGF